MALTSREMVLPFYSGGSLAVPDLCLIFTPSRVTMNQKFSLVQQNQSVSQALTSNRILCDLMSVAGQNRKSRDAGGTSVMCHKRTIGLALSGYEKREMWT